jgi:hypothetical protein
MASSEESLAAASKAVQTDSSVWSLCQLNDLSYHVKSELQTKKTKNMESIINREQLFQVLFCQNFSAQQPRAINHNY